MSIKTTTEKVSPTLARTYLQRNIHNRPTRAGVIEKYATSMRLGNWRLTHQGIAFDVEGNLVDGQHRLLAVVRAGVTVEMMVTKGLPSETQDYVDGQRVRSAADQLSLQGVPSAIAQTAVASAIAAICAPTDYKTFITIDQARGILDIYGDEIYETVKMSSSHPIGRRAPIKAVAAMYMKVSPDAGLEFFTRFLTGEGLFSGDPILALRQKLESTQTKKGPVYGEWVREWTANAAHYHATGRKMIRIPRGASGLHWLRKQQKPNVDAVRTLFGSASEPRWDKLDGKLL